jgi:hypothetical protein
VRAASVHSPMRRTLFVALLAAVLLVLPSAASAADPIAVLRDCNDDSLLQGDYTISELRKAQAEIPTDADEYGDCRDVLANAILAKTAGSSSSGGGGAAQNGGGATEPGTTGTATPDPAGAATPAPTSTPSPSVAVDPGIETGPVTPEDWAAVNNAQKDGDRADTPKGRDVSPMLVAEVGRNGLPTTLVIALVALCTAVLAACLLPLGRRVLRPRA